MQNMSSASSKQMAGRRVVIVGGGIAGSLLARHLQFHANVTLIDVKEYLRIPYGMMRAIVDPTFAHMSLINYTDFLPNVNIIMSAAADISRTHVITANGHRVAYDYLVIATGHEDSSPVLRDTKIDECLKTHQRIHMSDSILVVGGGSTGVETAAEIISHYPDKNVTLVHRGSRLLPMMGLKASQAALDWLTSKNVNVVLDQSVDLKSISDGVIRTPYNQKTITADCCFDCSSRPVGSSWMRRTMLVDNLDVQGRLAVDTNMRIIGHMNIFAIGDITNVQEMKLGVCAVKHAKVVAKNLKILMEGRNDNNLATYKASHPIVYIALGRKEAVAQIYSFTMSGRIAGVVKSGNLFVSDRRKKCGLS